MVDLQEPKKHEYSEEEQVVLKEQFILLLHTLLVVYLVLHNFLIPLVSNILTDRNLLSDLHFWFLFQIPVQYLLRKKLTIPNWYYYFLLFGTFARLGMELQLAPTLKSWGIFSLLLSELSSIIFYYLYFPFLKKKSPGLLSLLAFVIVPIMSVVEVRSEKMMSSNTRIAPERDDKVLGCKGSLNRITFPLEEFPHYPERVTIHPCGFSDSFLRIGQTFSVLNQSSHDINLRLYQLRVLHGKVSWKFVRLMQIPQKGTWDISEYLKGEKTALLLKSPERRKLGNLLIISKDRTSFPLGKGELISTYDTLQWSPYE